MRPGRRASRSVRYLGQRVACACRVLQSRLARRAAPGRETPGSQRGHAHLAGVEQGTFAGRSHPGRRPAPPAWLEPGSGSRLFHSSESSTLTVKHRRSRPTCRPRACDRRHVPTRAATRDREPPPGWCLHSRRLRWAGCRPDEPGPGWWCPRADRSVAQPLRRFEFAQEPARFGQLSRVSPKRKTRFDRSLIGEVCATAWA